MSRWDTGLSNMVYIGIYGQSVNFKDLDTSVQSVAMAEYVGADGELGEASFEVGVTTNTPTSCFTLSLCGQACEGDRHFRLVLTLSLHSTVRGR